jgi:hypothetical protein
MDSTPNPGLVKSWVIFAGIAVVSTPQSKATVLGGKLEIRIF